jgi:hypothetical protein
VGLIVVLVGVAVAVSIVVRDPADDDRNTAPLASEQFCGEASSFRSFDSLHLEDDGAAQLRDLSTSARRLASLAPPTIARDLDDVAQAFELVAQSVDQVPADDPDRLEIVTQRLDEELAGVKDQADEAGAYLDKWCGPIPTTVTTASDSSAPDATGPGTTTG